MALADKLTSITSEYFLPKMVDNIFTSNVLLMRARKKGWYDTVSGGTKMEMPVLYAKNTKTGWYRNSESLSTGAEDKWTRAEFEWQQAYVDITVTGRDRVLGGDDKAVVDLLSAEIQIAEKTLIDTLSTAIYNSGTDTKSLEGLRLAIDSAGTYGTISRTSYSWWSAQESNVTAFSISALQSLKGDCTVGNSTPSLGVCTQDVFDSILARIQPQQRLTDPNMASIGFQNVTYAGMPIVVDNAVPANHLFLINEDYIHIKVQKDRNFKMEPFVKPSNQDVYSAKIFWMGAMGINNCRMNGKFDSLAA